MSTYNLQDLKSHLELLQPSGYTTIVQDDNIIYKKNLSDVKIEIYFVLRKYFPHNVVFTGCSVLITYDNVEQIFHNVWINHQDIGFGHDLGSTYTFNNAFSNILSSSDKDILLQKDVYDYLSFNSISNILQQMLDAALNFVNQYSTLQSLYNYGETLSDDEKMNYYNQPASARMAIVKKLLNISYAAFLQDEITLYNQHNLTELANFSQTLKNYLDTL